MTTENVQAALRITLTFAQAIRAAGRIPSGVLYSAAAGHMSLDSYNSIIGILKKQGLVREEPSHELVWLGDPA